MGEIASVLMTMGAGTSGAGAAGMTAMGTGSGVAGAAGAMTGGSIAGGVGAGIGEIAAGAEDTIGSAAVGDVGGALGNGITTAINSADDLSFGKMASSAFDLMGGTDATVAGGENGIKDFFGQAWENTKNDLGKNVARNADGSVNYGKTAGNVGYGIAKSALLKAINAKDQGMPDQDQQAQPQPMKFSQPEAANAEDELNRLRNRMNVS